MVIYKSHSARKCPVLYANRKHLNFSIGRNFVKCLHVSQSKYRTAEACHISHVHNLAVIITVIYRVALGDFRMMMLNYLRTELLYAP